jgi:2'-5' RNA ligase
MLELGFENELRPFKAHLTLGRVKANYNEEILDSLIRTYQNKIFQAFKTDQLSLYESILQPYGSQYKIIKTFIFRKA